MTEKTTDETNPAVNALNAKIGDLQKLVKTNTDRIEDFTRERPMPAVCSAFLGGALVGFVIAMVAKRDRD